MKAPSPFCVAMDPALSDSFPTGNVIGEEMSPLLLL